MAGSKTVYVCDNCGYESQKWLGKCPECGSWSTFNEFNKSNTKSNSIFKVDLLKPQSINNIKYTDNERLIVGIDEFDRVLGGGLVKGSLILIGGDPGIGKSTIVLQVCKNISSSGKTILYVSGEESEQQIKLRANRIGEFTDKFLLLNETNLENICTLVEQIQPDLLVIDSIQTMVSSNVSAVAGSISQVKEATTILLKLAKITGTNIIIIGHVTKEGAVAGPRLLEHMVDTVLYIEGERYDSYRILRGVKNRFGSTNEIGVFEMTGSGLREVPNPSEIMLQGRPLDAPGSIVACVMEGTRPILIEIQALISQSSLPAPRRTAVGVDYNRVNLLMAVIEKRLKIPLANYDAYVNVVGGIKINEPAMDLPIVLAILSSYYNKAFGSNIASFGEIGLVGEVRAIANAQKRILEAKKIGFQTIILPQANINKINSIEGVKLRGIKEIQQLTNK